MKVYQPSVADGCEWALPCIDSDNLTILEAFGKPIGAGWTPVRMKLLEQDEHGHRWKKAEMPWMGEHLLVLKPRAVSNLRDICLQAGELLPLSCDSAELLAWNVTTVVDALDETQSSLERFPSGRIMSVNKYQFKSRLVQGLVAFRVPQIRTSIFLGPEFFEKAKEAGLTGTCFKEVWHG